MEASWRIELSRKEFRDLLKGHYLRVSDIYVEHREWRGILACPSQKQHVTPGSDPGGTDLTQLHTRWGSFKNIRTGLWNTHAPTLEHTDRVRPSPSECHKVNALLFSKWLADSVWFGWLSTLKETEKAPGCSTLRGIFFLPWVMVLEELDGDGCWLLLEHITISALTAPR